MGLLVGMGKTNKRVSSACGKGVATDQSIKHCAASGEKLWVCASVSQAQLVYVWNDSACKTRCRRTFHTQMTSFPGNIYLIFFFFQARLTYVIAEIAPKTAWKINLRVFEILWWIRQGCQLEPMFICFLTVGGIRVMLTQKVFVLSSVTDIMKGFLLQLVRNRTNLKQLCTLISSEIKKYACLSAK